jgi:DMSO/TMAO reductase YedYZ heme-binding membrane subunit
LNTAPLPAERVGRRANGYVGCAAALALAGVAAGAAARGWPPARELFLVRGTGWLATSALLLTFACAALDRLVVRVAGVGDRLTFRQARRALGMSSAWLALLHAGLTLTIRVNGNWAAVTEWPHLRAGLWALLTLVVLLVSSFAAVVARLRLGFARELQRSIYLAALLVLQHVLLSPFAPRGWTLGVFGAALLLVLVPRPPADAGP